MIALSLQFYLFSLMFGDSLCFSGSSKSMVSWGILGNLSFAKDEMFGFLLNGELGQKDATPRDHRWMGLFLLLPIRCFRYPAFLTPSQMAF